MHVTCSGTTTNKTTGSLCNSHAQESARSREGPGGRGVDSTHLSSLRARRGAIPHPHQPSALARGCRGFPWTPHKPAARHCRATGHFGRRAEKLKNRFGDDVRVGRFAGFDLFLRPSFNNTVEMLVRGKNSYTARVTDTAQGTIRSLEANVQGFEERATKLEYDIADATKRAKELVTKVGAHFEREESYQHLTRCQSEIEEKLDLTKNPFGVH